jgi:hypothetical protein
VLRQVTRPSNLVREIKVYTLLADFSLLYYAQGATRKVDNRKGDTGIMYRLSHIKTPKGPCHINRKGVKTSKRSKVSLS